MTTRVYKRGPCDGAAYIGWTVEKEYTFHAVEWRHTWSDGVVTNEHAWETLDDRGKPHRVSDTAIRNYHHWTKV